MCNYLFKVIHFTAIKDCKTFFAVPESIDSSASLIPSARDSAFPPTFIPAPAFKTTISRLGPVSPLKIFQIMSAFSSGSPPFSDSKSVVLNPKLEGESVPDLISPSDVVIDSSADYPPKHPW